MSNPARTRKNLHAGEVAVCRIAMGPSPLATFRQQRQRKKTTAMGIRMVGVLLPQIRGEYIRELMDGAETFGVRFANESKRLFADGPSCVSLAAGQEV